MFLSGLLPRPMTAEDDQKLLEHGIGFTNIVERTTKGTANLTRKEIEEGTFRIGSLRLPANVLNFSIQSKIPCNQFLFIFCRECNAYAKDPTISTKNCSF